MVFIFHTFEEDSFQTVQKCLFLSTSLSTVRFQLSLLRIMTLLAIICLMTSTKLPNITYRNAAISVQLKGGTRYECGLCNLSYIVLDIFFQLICRKCTYTSFFTNGVLYLLVMPISIFAFENKTSPLQSCCHSNFTVELH